MKNNRIPFDDVVIRLSRTTYFDDQHTFHAEIRHTPIPLQGGVFRIESDEQLEKLHMLFTGQVNFNRAFSSFGPQPEQTANDLALLHDKLYNLLPVSLCDDLPRLIQEVFERGRGVRLIIEASASDQADRLLSLPWELLFFKGTEVYPARSRRLLIVRRLLDAARHSRVEMTAPFNLVHVIADDPQQPIEVDLQQMEREAIPKTIAPGAYARVEQPGSVKKLRKTLDEQPAQILHFLGHGGAPEKEEKQKEKKGNFGARGYLCFVNEACKREWVTGERLQHILSDTPGAQLIVLSACHSASAISSHIALDLVYSGFPYVVAMQAEMHQEAAKHFIRAFYGQLQEGHSIEYAVAAGRCEIATQLPGAIDWCLPVLYTNVGLTKKSSLVQSAEYLGGWVQWVDNLLPVGLALGILHMVLGFLLWLSGQSSSLPDLDVIIYTTSGVVILPPFLTAWIYYFGELPIPANWPLPKRLILLSRLLGTVAFSLGGLMVLIVWFSLTLFAALGVFLWSSLIAQVLLLIPLLFITIWFSYMLAHRTGWKFITTVPIAPHIPWRERIGPPFAGYGGLLIALYLFYDSPDLFVPPEGNFYIGAFFLAACYLMHYFRDELENTPEEPWNI